MKVLNTCFFFLVKESMEVVGVNSLTFLHHANDCMAYNGKGWISGKYTYPKHTAWSKKPTYVTKLLLGLLLEHSEYKDSMPKLHSPALSASNSSTGTKSAAPHPAPVSLPYTPYPLHTLPALWWHSPEVQGWSGWGDWPGVQCHWSAWWCPYWRKLWHIHLVRRPRWLIPGNKHAINGSNGTNQNWIKPWTNFTYIERVSIIEPINVEQIPTSFFDSWIVDTS